MGHCPSQDWDDHVQHLEDQAEAEIAFYQKHADKIAAVAAGLARPFWSADDPAKEVRLLVTHAAAVVAEIVKRGEPVDGPDFGPNIEAEEMMRKTYEKKIAELEKERDDFAENLKRMTGYRDAIRDRSEAKIKELERELGEEGGKVIRLVRELAEANAKQADHVKERWRLVEAIEATQAVDATIERRSKQRYELEAFKSGRLGRVGLFGKTVAFTVAGRKDEPFTVAAFEVENGDLESAYAKAVELAFGRTPASEEGGGE